MKYYYSYGLPFDQHLARIDLELVKERVRINKAALLVVDGGVGEGKTTFMIHLADYLNGAYQLQPDGNYKIIPSKLINFDLNYSFGGNDFQTKLQICVEQKQLVIVYDEAGDFNKRGSLTGFNQQLNRIFETYRTFKIILILGLPCAKVLDNDLFIKGIVRCIIHLENRNEYYGDYRVFSLYNSMYLLEKLKKMVVPQMAYKYQRANARGHFLNLSPSRAQELARICDAGKKEILNTNVLKSRGLISLLDFAKKLNITKQYLNNVLQKAKVKEVSTYHRIRYFDSDAVATISKYLGR